MPSSPNWEKIENSSAFMSNCWFVGLLVCEYSTLVNQDTLRIFDPSHFKVEDLSDLAENYGYYFFHNYDPRILVLSPRRELDPRPTHYECVALPLSYPGATLILLTAKS